MDSWYCNDKDCGVIVCCLALIDDGVLPSAGPLVATIKRLPFRVVGAFKKLQIRPIQYRLNSTKTTFAKGNSNSSGLMALSEIITAKNNVANF